MFADQLIGAHTVDSASGNGIEELSESLASAASQMAIMGTTLSNSWAATKEAVRELAGRYPQLSYGEFTQLAQSHGVGSQREVEALAQLLNELGEVVYFGDDDMLSDMVVLNPEWLTKAIGYVLEDRATCDSDGILDHSRLREIWGGNVGRSGYPRAHHPYFLRLMERFDISYRLDGEEASLVAQLTPWDRPGLPWDSSRPRDTENRRIKVVCVLSDAAPGIVSWLTVRNHVASTGLYWRHGVFLRHPRRSSPPGTFRTS